MCVYVFQTILLNKSYSKYDPSKAGPGVRAEEENPRSSGTQGQPGKYRDPDSNSNTKEKKRKEIQSEQLYLPLSDSVNPRGNFP